MSTYETAEGPSDRALRAKLSHYADEPCTPEPADLHSLRGEYERCVERTRQLGYRAHMAADTIMGSVPTPIATGNTDRERPPASFLELTSQLHDALDNIERALARL